MNFADILDEWDRRAKAPGIYAKDEEKPPERKADKRRRLLRQKPDAVIDLHGLTQDAAWDALEDFFRHSRSMGFEKIVVIHGKGNHSQKKEGPAIRGANSWGTLLESEGVLKEITRKFIERCPFAGESGHNSGSAGGSGATWILLKYAPPLPK